MSAGPAGAARYRRTTDEQRTVRSHAEAARLLHGSVTIIRLVAYTAELAADEIDALDFYVARPRAAIYIDREVAKRRPKTARRRPLTGGGRKRVLVVLFVPSVQRDGVTAIDQAYWVDGALEMFGRVFGGATAYPRARGIWRDDDRGGALVKDEPVVVHCYTTPADIEDSGNLAELGSFCRRMGRDARQGEIGLVIGDEYFAIRDFGEEER